MSVCGHEKVRGRLRWSLVGTSSGPSLAHSERIAARHIRDSAVQEAIEQRHCRRMFGQEAPPLLERPMGRDAEWSRIDTRTLIPARSTNEPDLVNHRLRAAVMELVEALRDEIGVGARWSEHEPDRLLSIEQAAQALGIGRTALYSEIWAGRIRSVKVGRRRLIPSSAISEVASRQG